MQAIAQMDGIQRPIQEHENAIAMAISMQRKETALQECQRLEHELAEFMHNKDSKLEYLEVQTILFGPYVYPFSNSEHA